MDLFCFYVSLCLNSTVLSVPCSLVITDWDLALLCVMFPCALSLSLGILGQVWYLIISIPALCLLLYF